MSSQVRQRKRRIKNFSAAGQTSNRSGVADLATRLGIKRGPVEKQFNSPLAIFVDGGNHCDDTRLTDIVGVANELGDPKLLEYFAIQVDTALISTSVATSRFCPFALCFHLNLEPFEVNVDRPFSSNFFGEFKREAVGVMQQERSRTRQLLTPVKFTVEDAKTGLECVPESLFFFLHDAFNKVTVLHDVWVCGSHHIDRR